MTQPLSRADSAEIIDEISELNARIGSKVSSWIVSAADEISSALLPTFLASSRADVERQGYWEDSLLEMLADYHGVKYRSPGYIDLKAKLAQDIAIIHMDTPYVLTRLGNLIAARLTDAWDHNGDWPVERFSAHHMSKHPCGSECHKLICNDILFTSKNSSKAHKKKSR